MRTFVARQEQAWNARELDRYFANFAPEAVLTDQARAADGRIVPYGSSTRAQAMIQARKFLKTSKSLDRAAVQQVRITPGGDGARVILFRTSRLETAGKVRNLCAVSVQTLARSAGRLRTTAQTDTFVKCVR